MSPSSVPSHNRAGFTLLEIVIVMTLLAILSTAVFSAYLFMGRNLERLTKTQMQDVKGRRALFYFTRDIGSAISFSNTASANLTMAVPTVVTLTNCATVSGSKNVVCDTTSGLVVGMSLSCPPSILQTATVSSITNATTFVMNANAVATSAGLTVSAVGTPANVSYLYNLTADLTTTPPTPANSLTRKLGSSSNIIILLTDIDSSLSSPPNNRFVYYDRSGATVTSPASVKSVEFTFTTKLGSQANGTQSSYVLISPRVVVRNKQFLP